MIFPEDLNRYAIGNSDSPLLGDSPGRADIILDKEWC